MGQVAPMGRAVIGQEYRRRGTSSRAAVPVQRVEDDVGIGRLTQDLVPARLVAVRMYR